MADPAVPAEIPAASTAPAAESAPPAASPTPTPAAGDPGSQPAPVTDAPAGDKPAPVEGEKPADEPKPHTDEASLLETITGEKKDEAKKPEDGAKPPEAPKPEDGTPKPVFEFKPYTIPEGVKLDEGRFKELNDVLVNDKLDPQARGQELINLHTKEMQAYDRKLRTEQHEAFAHTRADWRKQAMGDEEIGGAGWETSKQMIGTAREHLVPRDREKAFNDFLRTTGAGDHPEFLRILRRAGSILSEPRAPSGDFKPPPDIGRAPNKASGRRGVIYDHPSSSNMNKSN